MEDGRKDICSYSRSSRLTSSYEYHNSSNHSTLKPVAIPRLNYTNISFVNREIRALWTLSIVASSA